jgi:ribonuclease III
MEKKNKIEYWYQLKDFAFLEKQTKAIFKDKSLLVQAFVHRSFLNENPEFPLGNNERLEFLGDAVLELSTTEYLYCKYSASEGELTRWRAALVNTKKLSQLAQKLEFKKYLLLSHGELNGQISDGVLADTVEAFIGAIYLDQGQKRVDRFIVDNILILLQRIIDQSDYIDAKSKLQELIQSQGRVAPCYEIIQTEGPDHAKNFKVGVLIDGQIVSTGSGGSRQMAEQDAAERALHYFKKNR